MKKYVVNVDGNEQLNWDALSEELHEWAEDATDFTQWDWVDEDRKAQLSEEALREVEAILDEINK